MATLTVLSGPHHQSQTNREDLVFQFGADPKKTCIIGRGVMPPGLQLGDDSLVSKKHATVFKTDNGYAIRDENSSNGTTIVRGGSKLAVDDEMILKHGDKILVGDTEIVFSDLATEKNIHEPEVAAARRKAGIRSDLTRRNSSRDAIGLKTNRRENGEQE